MSSWCATHSSPSRRTTASAHRQASLSGSATFTTVNAEVISRNPGDTAVTLTLDKGTAHGVAKGALVTTIDGMVGYVSEAGSNTCEVTTVTDVDMQCGALITRTRETAIAEGSYDLMSEAGCAFPTSRQAIRSLSAIRSRPRAAAAPSPRAS